MKTKNFSKSNFNLSAKIWLYLIVIFLSTIFAERIYAQPNLLKNGSFESPDLNHPNTHTTFYDVPPDFKVPGWRSVEPPNNSFELWTGSGGFNGGPGAIQGNQYLELNSQGCGAIYQDFDTKCGDILWSFFHSARGPCQNRKDYVEILIGTPGNMVSQHIFGDNESQWFEHSDYYNVPVGQCTTRIELKCVSGGCNSNPSLGNFLDSVKVIASLTRQPVVEQSPETTACPGVCKTLTVGGTICPGENWKWYRGSCGGTFVGTGPSSLVCPSVTTTYFVRREGGCVLGDCASTIVSVLPKPDVTLAVDNNTYPCCPVIDVTGGTPAYSYVWSSNNIVLSTSSSLPCPPPLTNGSYQVIVTDANGCPDTAYVDLDCHNPCADTCPFWAVGGNYLNNGGRISLTNNIIGCNDVGLNGVPAPSAAQTNKSPLRIFTNSTERMKILYTGEVGINTGIGPAIGTRLQIKGNTNQKGILSQVIADDSNTYPPGGGPGLITAVRGEIINCPNSGCTAEGIAGYFSSRPKKRWAGYFVGDLKIVGDGWLTTTRIMSDGALKKNVNKITGALNTIQQLNPKSFDFRVNDFPYLNLPSENQYGFIAQDVQNVLPSLVASSEFVEETDSTGDIVSPASSYLGLNYIGLIPIAIKAIQELDSLRISSGVSASSPLTVNHLPKSTGGDSLSNSQIFDDGLCVGIGTDTVPLGYKCVVEGKFGCRDVIVACPPSWPDHVFSQIHSLKELEELENYVVTNKHLPGIPSSNELRESGLNVGEMQTKQMEKIEELYLYIIVMNKNMNKLSAENKDLKERMKKLDSK